MMPEPFRRVESLDGRRLIAPGILCATRSGCSGLVRLDPSGLD